MGVLQRFERRIEEMVNRPFARAFKAEVAARRDRQRAAARVRRPGGHRRPRPHHGAQRVRRGARRARPRAAQRLRRAARRRARRDGARARRRAGLRVRRPGHRRLRAGRRAADRPLPGAQRRGRRRRRGRAGQHRRDDHRRRRQGAVGRGRQHDVRAGARLDPGGPRRRVRPAHRRPRHLPGHAELRLSGGDVTIVDLGSTNGVLVDGQRVDQQRLRDGAEVRLGSTTLVFHQAGR